LIKCALRCWRSTEDLPTSASPADTHTESQTLKTLRQRIAQLEQQPPSTPKPPPAPVSPFAAEINAFAQFKTLKANTQSALAGIFKEPSAVGFIACGVQEKNLLSLWDYTKNRLMEQADAETAILVELFYFLFSRYRLAYPNYRLQEVTLGEAFDPEQHIRSSQSRASGAISKVLLSGWVNNKNQKIIKTSVVEINS